MKNSAIGHISYNGEHLAAGNMVGCISEDAIYVALMETRLISVYHTQALSDTGGNEMKFAGRVGTGDLGIVLSEPLHLAGIARTF